MTFKALLCSDLDRTLLPNGPQDESPLARPLLRALALRPEITLAYVSGRHKELQIEAIEKYGIPYPDFAIGDVGTTIYEISHGEWKPWEAWYEEIAPDWGGLESYDLAHLFEDVSVLSRQEPEKQNRFKLSFYAPEDADRESLLKEAERRLTDKNILANLTWSVDEVAHVGLLDVLPKSASKAHAIDFLMRRKGFSESDTVFAGDSGNDLPALTSGLNAVLVANAQDSVREEALKLAEERDLLNTLYFARGGFLGMNGNYSAGALEGLAHFVPEAGKLMEELAGRLSLSDGSG